ncbi:MAG TPA: S53 family peptidase [Ktedonobacteraceae bacterium]|jgi:subtilase family serine protease|nr:S53 family peptidase [Ktedonobacteraceae bacterium]
MPNFTRLCLLLLTIACLLTACNTTVLPKGQDAIQPTPSAASDKNQTDICPSYLQRAQGCLTPYAMRVAYGVEPLFQQGYTGKGQTIIDIVSFGSPTLRQDMKVFDQQFGLPPVDLDIISPLHMPEYDPQGDKAGWGDETTLDVQIIHAIAPDAKIVVLTSPVAETQGTIGLPEFRQLLQYALDHHLGNIVSQSWGASELTLQDEAGQQELALWNTLFENATKQGMTLFASSGDNGATDYADLSASKMGTVPTTSFPADSPWVTGVGGTTIQHHSPNYSEQAWSNSGGGFSRFYKTPSYQQNESQAVKNELAGRRGVPDVSAAANPYTGLAIYGHGNWTLAGGTSASAPLWAGIAAIGDQMAGHPLGLLNPALYKIAGTDKYTQDFRDITQGNNTNAAANVQGYQAVPGWDPVTGLGSPIADKLLPDLIHGG